MITSAQRADVILQNHRRLITAILTLVGRAVVIMALQMVVIIVLTTHAAQVVVQAAKPTTLSIVIRIRATIRFAMS